MKNVKENVKSAGAVVAEATYEEFETIAEATSFFDTKEPGKGEATVLSLLNTQYGTNVKNKARQEATKKPSKEDFLTQAQGQLSTLSTDDLVKLTSNPADLQAWFKAKAAEAEKTWDDNQAKKLADLKAKQTTEESSEAGSEEAAK